MYWFNKKFCAMFINFVILLFLLTGCGAGGGGGSSGNSTTSDSTPPSAPSGVAAIAGDGQVTLSWNAVSNASSYNLYMASGSGVNKSNYSTLPDGMKHAGVTSPYIHTGLVNGKTYYFVLTAVDADGESNESVQVSAIPTSPKGNLSGKLLVGPSLSQAVKILPKATETEESNVQQADFVIGEVIGKFKQAITISEGVTKLQETFKSENLKVTSEISVINAVVLRANIYDAFQKGTLSKEEALQKTLDLIQQIQSLSFIEYAEPNYIGSAQSVPNDPGFSQQRWHYETIALPQAWGITTGNSNVIVAVLDDGIRFKHPDLEGNILSTGYDFVSDLQCAGDGNGIDSDPTAPLGNTHGTHVAGTIAALSNNRIGVAGVAWNVKIMPIRVIGCNGYHITVEDLMQGLSYAAGFSNSSNSIPLQKAKIINMSLRIPGSPKSLQDTINQVVAQGITVIAAAGNDALKGNPIIYPCAYDNVICVGAVGPSLTRASYSEYNSYVDVVAPGGEMGFFTSYNGVYSTVYDYDDRPAYDFSQGTSMATPHVSGVAALMLSVNPDLTPTQIEQILKETAYDMGPSGRDNEYGYGLINAFRAVGYGILAGTPVLQAQPVVLYLTSANLLEFISVLNIGGGSLTISSVTNTEKSGGNWLSTFLDKSIAPATVTATVNPSGLSPGVYGATISISTNGGNKKIPVIFDNRTTPDLGTITVWLLDISGNSVSQTTTSKTQGYTYEFTNLEPGQYYVVAGTDWSGNGVPGDKWGEFIGTFPMLGDNSTVTVEAGKTTSGTDFSLHDIGDLVYFDGNGVGPINGALLVTVLDETGEPVEGAKVYVGDGRSFSGTTNFFGRATIIGSFSGPQTVTATAPVHTTSTFYQTNASYLTFSLSRINPPTTTLTVTLTGLTYGESGLVFIGDDMKSFTYTGVNPTLIFTVDRDKPLTISAFANDILGSTKKFAHAHYPEGLNTSTFDSLSMTEPPSWHYFGGGIILPSGNFNTSIAMDSMLAYGYAYLGLHQDALFTGFQSISNPLSWTLKVAETDDPENNAIAVWIKNSMDEGTVAFTHAPFDQLPFIATFFPYDVPYLWTPFYYITVSSLTPTLYWDNTFQPSMQGIVISDKSTGYEWEIDVPGSITSITLPNIPTGGLSGGTTYEWDVINMVAPPRSGDILFDYNNFDMKYVEQTMYGLSWSQTGHFITP